MNMALQTFENPPIRAPRLGSVVDAGAPWWLAHTRSRMEKAFVRDLIYLGIDYFFPLVSHIRYSGGRKRHRALEQERVEPRLGDGGRALLGRGHLEMFDHFDFVWFSP